jgi:hypothetical protein
VARFDATCVVVLGCVASPGGREATFFRLIVKKTAIAPLRAVRSPGEDPSASFGSSRLEPTTAKATK